MIINVSCVIGFRFKVDILRIQKSQQSFRRQGYIRIYATKWGSAGGDAVRKVVTDSDGSAVTAVAEGGVIPVVCSFIPTRHCYSHSFRESCRQILKKTVYSPRDSFQSKELSVMFRMRRSRRVDVFDVDYETSMKLILFLTLTSVAYGRWFNVALRQYALLGQVRTYARLGGTGEQVIPRGRALA